MPPAFRARASQAEKYLFQALFNLYLQNIKDGSPASINIVAAGRDAEEKGFKKIMSVIGPDGRKKVECLKGTPVESVCTDAIVAEFATSIR